LVPKGRSMNFYQASKVQKVRLTRDLTKHIKRGNPWLFSDVLPKDFRANQGALTQVLNQKNEILGMGYYAQQINLSIRLITIGEKRLTPDLIKERILNAFELRAGFISKDHQALRLINGEGDELPGIIADYYDGLIVLKLDGEASESFWIKEDLASFFMEQDLIPVKAVYFKRKNRDEEKGLILKGSDLSLEAYDFKENTVFFRTNIIDAAKTGFFIDQRDNRKFISSVSKDKTLLNLFGYTGGFSVFAGVGGAKKVTTVDIAPMAIEASKINWSLNKLSPEKHEAICADAFAYVEKMILEKRTWDIVITDPPSFAPNEKAVEKAKEAYIRIFADSIKLVKNEGFFAASSCSGHISFEEFIFIVEEALSKARRRGKVIVMNGQPFDHPFPMAMKELRYLKFIYLQVFKD